MSAALKPTYGELIAMLEAAEGEAKANGGSVSEILISQFHHQYPRIPIGRKGRFYDTVQRIAAPIRSSTRSRQLNGSPLRSYLGRVWMPRIRNTRQGMLHKTMKMSWHYLEFCFPAQEECPSSL